MKQLKAINHKKPYMLPGPNFVYKCPNCDNLLTKKSVISGNTYGSKIFSDGKRIAPMLPDFPELTKCKQCNTIFWLSKMKEIGTYEWGDNKNPKWQNTDDAEFLTIDDYFQALEAGMAEDKNEESYIRQQIWWTYNDRVRNGENMCKNEEDELRWKENVSILLSLLDQDDLNQKIMMAEINRNLGNFENCMNIVESIDNDELNWLKEFFFTECKRKNTLVVALN